MPKAVPAPDSQSRAPQQLESLKLASVAQLLFKAARLWNEQAIARLQQRFPEVRMAHTAVLPHVGWEGTRITELAARMGVTKQAASQIVQDMARIGLLELRPDPEDGRAKRVYFSQAGTEAMGIGLQTLQEMQAELNATFGAQRMDHLLSLLQDLVPLLEARGAALPR